MEDKDKPGSLLIEIAWEVCNQVGGIYTVIRSKVPVMKSKWGDDYCLIGPYVHSKMPAEFEPFEDSQDEFFKAAQKLREYLLSTLLAALAP